MVRRIALRILLATALTIVTTIPVVAVDETAQDDTRQPSSGSTALGNFVRALNSLPGLVWPDAPVPASLAPFLPAARAQLWSHAIDGLRLPLHLRFIEARCSADGEKVALLFEELRPPYLTRTYAYTTRRGMPTSVDDGWGNGGFGLSSVLDDDEFIHLMGDDTVPCP